MSRLAQTDQPAPKQPATPAVVGLYRRAFAEFGARALWNIREVETEPTLEEVLAITRRTAAVAYGACRASYSLIYYQPGGLGGNGRVSGSIGVGAEVERRLPASAHDLSLFGPGTQVSLRSSHASRTVKWSQHAVPPPVFTQVL